MGEVSILQTLKDMSQTVLIILGVLFVVYNILRVGSAAYFKSKEDHMRRISNEKRQKEEG